MPLFRCPRFRGFGSATLLLALSPPAILAQNITSTSTRGVASSDSVGDSIEIVAGAQYQAGGLHRMLLGGAYRDLWATPVRAQVLDLETYGGGLQPLKESGGNQTKSLRFVTSGGTEYVFRSVNKDDASFPFNPSPAIRSAHIFRLRHSSPHRCSRPPASSTSRPSSWSCPTIRGWASSRRTSPTASG